MKAVNFSVLLFILILSCASCNSRKKITRLDTVTSGLAMIGVDESFAQVIDEQIMVFEAKYPDASIIPVYTTEKNLYDLLMKDSIRLILGTRELSKAELFEFEEKQRTVKTFKLASDAIALVVNKQNPDSLLTMNQIKGVMTGELLTWKDINPKSKLGNIDIVFDTPKSSVIRFIQTTICDDKPLTMNASAITSDSTSINLNDVNSNLAVIDYVASHPNALGVVGVSWILPSENTPNFLYEDKIKVVALTRSDKATIENSFKPTQFNIALESAYRLSEEKNELPGYPLYRELYIINTDVFGGLPFGFQNFLLSERGQKIISKSGLIPEKKPSRIIEVTE